MAIYNPGNPPSDPKELSQYLRLEHEKISQALSAPVEQIDMRILSAVPSKFRNGTIVQANGTTWNPGSGAGAYCYYAGSWKFLG